MKFVTLEVAFSEGLAWTSIRPCTLVNQTAATDLNIKLPNTCEVHGNRHREGRTCVVAVNEITLMRVQSGSIT
jgi:hypothetical protein